MDAGESEGRRYRIQNDVEDKKNTRLTGYGRATLVHVGPWGATKKRQHKISRATCKLSSTTTGEPTCPQEKLKYTVAGKNLRGVYKGSIDGHGPPLSRATRQRIRLAHSRKLEAKLENKRGRCQSFRSLNPTFNPGRSWRSDSSASSMAWVEPERNLLKDPMGAG